MPGWTLAVPPGARLVVVNFVDGIAVDVAPKAAQIPRPGAEADAFIDGYAAEELPHEAQKHVVTPAKIAIPTAGSDASHASVFTGADDGALDFLKPESPDEAEPIEPSS